MTQAAYTEGELRAMRDDVVRGVAPEGGVFPGNLDLRSTGLERLPDGLIAVDGFLDVSRLPLRALPVGLNVHGNLCARECRLLDSLDEVTIGGSLIAPGSALEVVGSRVSIGGGVSLMDCASLEWLRIPSSQLEFMNLERCTALRVIEGPLCVKGMLDLSGATDLERLPAEMRVGSLSLRQCASLHEFPRGTFEVWGDLYLGGCAIVTIPDAVVVHGRLHAEELSVRQLLSVSDPFVLERLVPQFGAVRLLEDMPPGTRLRCDLPLDEFPRAALPRDGLHVAGDVFMRRSLIERLGPMHADGDIVLAGSARLVELSPQTDAWLLDVSDCTSLRRIPDGVRAMEVDVANTGLTELPPSLDDATIRWRGTRISRRIAFEPERIHIDDVRTCGDRDLRQALLQRIGVQRLCAEGDAEVIDSDRDVGGARRLLRVEMPDEDLHVLACVCPSTSKTYFLRVPPNMRTARQAAAWMAGLPERRYRPLVET